MPDQVATNAQPKTLEVVPISPPPDAQRVRRDAAPAAEGKKKTRYCLPDALESPTVVGYRTRIPLTHDEATAAMPLLSLARPASFVAGDAVLERELFEECSLGIMSARQSTNYRGFRQVTLGPADSQRAAELLRELNGVEAPVLDGAAHTHLVISRPYRTPFTLLLTLAGHKAFTSLFTVPLRALRKRFQHIDDIPTIGYLQDLHIGILADAMERAAVIASAGRRAANVIMAPFGGEPRAANKGRVTQLQKLAGLTASERSHGWHIALAVQVGAVSEEARIALDPPLARKLGANLLAFRSERIQPGVNQEEKAPPAYQSRQDMRFPDELIVQAGRAAYNAFAHWTGVDRERSKELLLLDRIDVLTPGGKERLRAIRRDLGDITDKMIKDIPLWADIPTGRAFSKNARRGKKAFALAGQRIYVAGLSRSEIKTAGLDWIHAIRATGAAAARSALYCELMGVVDLPPDCDLLAGMCLMAGPVNQNDVGKQFYAYPDLLAGAHPDLDPTSMLVWTFKAKTVADPIGNEEQLMNSKRKGALVDLRPGPHEVVSVRQASGASSPMRSAGGQVNRERAFGDQGNFVTALDGAHIPGNGGAVWPDDQRNAVVWGQ